MATITPFIWFASGAEEAAEFYVSLFPNSSVDSVQRWGEGAPAPAGTAMSVAFRLDGVQYQAFNGGPYFTLNEAFSLFVGVETQDEIDRLWDAFLADGGTPSQCGWLRDRFGLSWQIIPTILDELLGDPDPARATRAREAMLSMGKLDIAALKAAHAG